MNSRIHLLLTLATGALSLTCLCSLAAPPDLVVAARTASPKPAAVKPGPTETPAAAPRSVFVIPRKSVDGKDPFYPNSTRVYASDVIAKPLPTPGVTVEMTLKGISGTPEQPLAIINSTTFTTGESNEILLKNGRIRVQCLEINMTAGTVLIQIGTERRELRLTPLK